MLYTRYRYGTNPWGLLWPGGQGGHLLGVGDGEGEGRFSFFLPEKSLRIRWRRSWRFLYDFLRVGCLCTFTNRPSAAAAARITRRSQLSSPRLGQAVWSVRQAAWTVHHVQKHALQGHSPPTSPASQRVGPALYFSASKVVSADTYIGREYQREV